MTRLRRSSTVEFKLKAVSMVSKYSIRKIQSPGQPFTNTNTNKTSLRRKINNLNPNKEKPRQQCVTSESQHQGA